MARSGARHFAAAGETELAVQLAGLGEGDPMRRREGSQERARTVEEAEGRIAVEHGVEGRHAARRLRLDGRHPRTLELLQEFLAPLAGEQWQERGRRFRNRGRRYRGWRRCRRRRRSGSRDGNKERSGGAEEAACHRGRRRSRGISRVQHFSPGLIKRRTNIEGTVTVRSWVSLHSPPPLATSDFSRPHRPRRIPVLLRFLPPEPNPQIPPSAQSRRR